MKYDPNLKKTIIAKMLLPDSPNISDLAEEYGIPVTTLYNWGHIARNGACPKIS